MVYKVVEGTGPLVVSMPHAGALTPEEVAERMTDAGRAAADTDWHVNRLYEFLSELEVPHIRSIYSRYVCDLNRPPDGSPLYEGEAASELCPTRTFDGEAIYQDGCAPGEDEIRSRWRDYWQPYHLALANLMLQAKDRYGVVVLLEAHTIRSQIPRLFEGTLPDFNIGTRAGSSCAPELRDSVAEVVEAAEGYSHTVDGRFQGGFITRSYGRRTRARTPCRSNSPSGPTCRKARPGPTATRAAARCARTCAGSSRRCGRGRKRGLLSDGAARGDCSARAGRFGGSLSLDGRGQVRVGLPGGCRGVPPSPSHAI
ncbi:MAG: N-formylglutamate amidohydrolase [Rhodovibrio sp.]|nr:N-formylglutamate amidohydrolase [Rhodovibrio sp.]